MPDGAAELMTTVSDAPGKVPPVAGDPAEVSGAGCREAMGHCAAGVTVITSVDTAGEPVVTIDDQLSA